jgi:hypothetical protein
MFFLVGNNRKKTMMMSVAFMVVVSKCVTHKKTRMLDALLSPLLNPLEGSTM